MISVRRILIGEGELYKQVRLMSLREAPYSFSSTYESALLRSTKSWSEQADATAQGSDRSTFIAFSNDSPIGIAALYRHSEGADVGEVLQVWVAPGYRNAGVASKLMDAIFWWAGENGFRKIIATVTKENMGALEFYRKYGFNLADDASLDGSDDFVLMKKVAVEQLLASDVQPRSGDA
jgi:ribosomal protein S18 acetylase RimI-like enzyme